MPAFSCMFNKEQNPLPIGPYNYNQTAIDLFQKTLKQFQLSILVFSTVNLMKSLMEFSSLMAQRWLSCSIPDLYWNNICLKTDAIYGAMHSSMNRLLNNCPRGADDIYREKKTETRLENGYYNRASHLVKRKNNSEASSLTVS